MAKICIEKYEKVLEGFELDVFFYQNGRVWRTKVMNGHRQLIKLPKPEIASRPTSRGYRRINYNKVTVYEHTLIYALFNGVDKLKEVDCVDHINADKGDNRIENLDGVSIRENNHRAESMGLVNRTYGNANGMCKIPQENILRIKSLRERGLTQYEIAAIIGISQGYVSEILRGKKRKYA